MNEQSIDRLAKRIAELIKANRNPPSTALRIGVVVSSNPIKIKWGESVILTEDKLILPKLYTDGVMIPNRYRDTNGQMVDEELLWKLNLENGQKVVIAPDEHLKNWFLIDVIG
ncbi:DUF2577 family protein [Paenibacillus thermotolerans]|uniref:DUF2577 family protein n=1 Tax=Paenibacillus thermotolerans TaxID=3027807 RepID=UPI002367F0A3|nr:MULTISPECIES: DUF2577 family protein [unclassified Paenibacillus]